MRILILTQKVDKNDPILGFFHRWIEEFSKNFEKVTVVCLEKGSYDLAENVEVLSLGKEESRSRIRYILRFYRYIWNKKHEYDVVFVHMNQIYVLLGGLLWRMWRKPIGLWYAHKKVSLSLKIAVRLANYIFSVSKESFRYETEKLCILGHGIDTNRFHPGETLKTDTVPRILTVGRIAPIKNIDVMIDAVYLLKQNGISTYFDIVGDAIYVSDKEYLDALKNKVSDLGLSHEVNFLGSVPNTEIPSFYRSADVFLNLSNTGSVDKAVLEAMASGSKVLTSNDAFRSILDTKYLSNRNAETIAKDLEYLLSDDSREDLRRYVKEFHNLAILVPKMKDIFIQKTPSKIR